MEGRPVQLQRQGQPGQSAPTHLQGDCSEGSGAGDALLAKVKVHEGGCPPCGGAGGAGRPRTQRRKKIIPVLGMILW